jgi:hypothetical protein
MPDVLPRSLLRSVRWAMDEARMMLAADDALCDLARYRDTLAMMNLIANPHAGLSEAAALLEAEIQARERVQERAARVLNARFTSEYER